jgi:hypothetical protein
LSPEEESVSHSDGEESLRRPLAYREESFLQSAESRPLRILSEYLWPLTHFRDEKIQDTIVFFGSARIQETGPLGRYYQEARELAGLLTTWAASVAPPAENSEPHRRFVICSGGGPGIMEAANRGASEAGGKTIGLNICRLNSAPIRTSHRSSASNFTISSCASSGLRTWRKPWSYSPAASARSMS